MGNKSKAARARLNNLPKAPVKSYKATVEDWGDSDGSDYALDSEDGMCDMATVSDSCDGEILHAEKVSQGSGNLYFAFEEEGLEDFSLDEDSEPEGSEFDEADIIDDANLLTFANVLQIAQEAALEAERKKDESKKRRKHYTGNSERSLRRFRANRKAIAAAGKQTFIDSWITASKEDQGAQPSPAPVSVSKQLIISVKLGSLKT